MSRGDSLKDFKNPKLIVDNLSKVYIENKLKSQQNYPGPYKKYDNDREYSEKLINKFEREVDNLKDNDRLIIYNEVLLGKKGDWYLEIMSQSTYYRYRRGAYLNFISCLQR